MFLSVCLSVCHIATPGFDCAKMAEWIEVRFGVKTNAGLRNVVLDGCPDPLTPLRGEGSTFDAAFAKLFWPLFLLNYC